MDQRVTKEQNLLFAEIGWSGISLECWPFLLRESLASVSARSLIRIDADEDSILSFNYDLLVDQEILRTKREHFERFVDAVFDQFTGVDSRLIYGASKGLLLKMHGSLNWLQCTNLKCRGHSRIDFEGKLKSA